MSIAMEIMYERPSSVFPCIFTTIQGGRASRFFGLDLAQLQEFHGKIDTEATKIFFLWLLSVHLEKTTGYHSFLAEKVLSHFQTASAKKIKIGKEKRYSKPQSFRIFLSFKPRRNKKKAMKIALSWLVCCEFPRSACFIADGANSFGQFSCSFAVKLLL